MDAAKNLVQEQPSDSESKIYLSDFDSVLACVLVAPELAEHQKDILPDRALCIKSDTITILLLPEPIWTNPFSFGLYLDKAQSPSIRLFCVGSAEALQAISQSHRFQLPIEAPEALARILEMPTASDAPKPLPDANSQWHLAAWLKRWRLLLILCLMLGLNIYASTRIFALQKHHFEAKRDKSGVQFRSIVTYSLQQYLQDLYNKEVYLFQDIDFDLGKYTDRLKVGEPNDPDYKVNGEPALVIQFTEFALEEKPEYKAISFNVQPWNPSDFKLEAPMEGYFVVFESYSHGKIITGRTLLVPHNPTEAEFYRHIERKKGVRIETESFRVLQKYLDTSVLTNTEVFDLLIATWTHGLIPSDTEAKTEKAKAAIRLNNILSWILIVVFIVPFFERIMKYLHLKN